MRIFGRDHSLAKTFFTGTHRSRPPGDTVRDYSRFMPQMGITRLANVTGLDFVGIPVYMAIRPNSRNLSVSQGKGLDNDAAKASALMESIEGWHAERVDLPLRYESYQSLRRRAHVIDVEKLPRMTAAPLRLSAPIRWVEGWDLIQERPTWVPHEMVNLDYVVPDDAPLTWVQGSNGFASGNSLLEAIEHALSEVIERDAVSLWQLDEDDESTKGTQVDLASIDDPGCLRVLEKLTAANIGVGMWDVTADTGIPTYYVSIYDKPGLRILGIFSGAGCHLSPAVAANRALTEAVQARLTSISGTRDDLEPRDYTAVRNEDDLRSLEQGLREPPAPRRFGDRPALSTSTFEGDIGVLLGALKKIGIDSAVAVDLSRPEIGIAVTKVIVPGLEDQVSNALPGPRARDYVARTRR